LRRPDVILFVLLPVRILDGDGSPLPDTLNDSRFDECIGLLATLDAHGDGKSVHAIDLT
jgi:hypothetical protein